MMITVLQFVFCSLLSLSINVIFHEVTHCIAARALSFPISNIDIGSKFMSIKLGKWSISPFVYKGCTIISTNSKSKIHMVIFYLSGTIGNFIILFVSLYIDFGVFKILLQLIAVAQIVFSLIPVNGSDLLNLIKTIKTF